MVYCAELVTGGRGFIDSGHKLLQVAGMLPTNAMSLVACAVQSQYTIGIEKQPGIHRALPAS